MATTTLTPALVLLLLGGIASSASVGSRYMVTDLGPGSFEDLVYSDMNALGTVVSRHGRWDGQQFVPVTAAFAGGPTVTVVPTAINDFDQIIASPAGFFGIPATIVVTGGAATYLTCNTPGTISCDPAGVLRGAAYAINNDGTVACALSAPIAGCLWKDGTLTVLTPGSAYPAGSFAFPIHLNDQGHVAGYVTDVSGAQRAFLWSGGDFTDLGPGAPRRINEHDQIVGRARLDGGGDEPVLWSPGGGKQVFQPSTSHAIDLNDAGVAVGYNGGFPHDTASRALLWSDPSTPLDLNDAIPADSGWTLLGALRINERGQVLGDGLKGSAFEFFRLEPVPLEVELSDNPDPAGVEQAVTYLVEVRNEGSSPATDFDVFDTLPNGLTFEPSASDPTCQASSLPGGVTCTIGDLPPGGADVTYIAATADAPGTFTNRVDVTATIDGAQVTISLSEDTTVGPAGPDLVCEWSHLKQRCRRKGPRQKCRLAAVVEVRNQGARQAGRSAVGFSAVDPDRALGRVQIGPLRPGQSRRAVLHARFMPTTPPKVVSAVADVGQVVAETNEANNGSSEITPPP